MLVGNPIEHDEYTARLGNLDPTLLEHVNDHGMVVPLVTITGDALIQALVINTATIQWAIDRVAAEIMHWGRLMAGCRRVLLVRQREYRSWQAVKELSFRRDSEAAGKKVTEALVEAHYRTDPSYSEISNTVERAEEAFNVAEAVYKAFKYKAELLKADVRRTPDGALQRLSP